MSGHMAPTNPVEHKVKASTLGAGGVVAVFLIVLSAINEDDILTGFPDWVPVLVGVLLAAGAAFQSGYSAKHTPRPELPAVQR